MTTDKAVSDFCLHKQAAKSAKAEDLTGAALDWAVATAEDLLVSKAPVRNLGSSNTGFWLCSVAEDGELDAYHKIGGLYSPSTNWNQAGSIIEREKISLSYDHGVQAWLATKTARINLVQQVVAVRYGSTATEAAMRCHVTAKLGSIIEIPEGLEL